MLIEKIIVQFKKWAINSNYEITPFNTHHMHFRSYPIIENSDKPPKTDLMDKNKNHNSSIKQITLD